MIDLSSEISLNLRDVADFPKPGILFKDITPLLQNPTLCRRILAQLADEYKGKIDVVCGIESRGFMFGFALAEKLQIPFVPLRKKGKLPFHTISHSYALEYGEATLEMHLDALKAGQRVLIHDDLLATGGTAAAAAELVKKLDADLQAFHFLVELRFLNGRESLLPYTGQIHSSCIIND